MLKFLCHGPCENVSFNQVPMDVKISVMYANNFAKSAPLIATFHNGTSLTKTMRKINCTGMGIWA